ncbi:hypothetical protein [Nonomuraea jabiensis]|uniref:hypothetical protein n=1 Tax=Nonomuraea jabiensis TaxID=882448 RepID=UPI00368836F0
MTTRRLLTAVVAAGFMVNDGLVRFTEFPDQAYSRPDHHAAVGPAHETRPIRHWLLEQ